jgi:hypothetical protein
MARSGPGTDARASRPGALRSGRSTSKLVSRPLLERSALAGPERTGASRGSGARSDTERGDRGDSGSPAALCLVRACGMAGRPIPCCGPAQIATGDPISPRCAARGRRWKGLHAAARAAAPEPPLRLLLRPTMERLLRLVPRHMRHPLVALATKPAATLGRPPSGEFSPSSISGTRSRRGFGRARMGLRVVPVMSTRARSRGLDLAAGLGGRYRV